MVVVARFLRQFSKEGGGFSTLQVVVRTHNPLSDRSHQAPELLAKLLYRVR